MNALPPEGMSTLEGMPSASSPDLGKNGLLDDGMWIPIECRLATYTVAFPLAPL